MCASVCVANIYGSVQALLHLEVVSKYAANQGRECRLRHESAGYATGRGAGLIYKAVCGQREM